MSPQLASLFTINGRRNRKSFFLTQVAIFFITLVIYFVLEAAIMVTQSSFLFSLIALVLFIVGVLELYVHICLCAQRFHDTGRTAWWYLAYCVPILNFFVILYQLFCPGTFGPNRYGPDPLRPNGTTNQCDVNFTNP